MAYERPLSLYKPVSWGRFLQSLDPRCLSPSSASPPSETSPLPPACCQGEERAFASFPWPPSCSRRCAVGRTGPGPGGPGRRAGPVPPWGGPRPTRERERRGWRELGVPGADWSRSSPVCWEAPRLGLLPGAPLLPPRGGSGGRPPARCGPGCPRPGGRWKPLKAAVLLRRKQGVRCQRPCSGMCLPAVKMGEKFSCHPSRTTSPPPFTGGSSWGQGREDDPPNLPNSGYSCFCSSSALADVPPSCRLSTHGELLWRGPKSQRAKVGKRQSVGRGNAVRLPGGF